MISVAFITMIAAFQSTTPSPRQMFPFGRIIGSVEIPALHDGVNKGEARTRSVTLYSEPRDGARPAVVVRDRAEVESISHACDEISAAVVDMEYGGNERFYLVQYKKSNRWATAWLAQRDAGTYRDLGTLLIGHMAFLTNAWNGLLFDQPRADASSRKFRGVHEHQDAAVASVAMADGSKDLWLLVVVLDGSVCGGPRTVIAAGWIPAHSKDGKLTTWHYACGC